jgi:hypothetical protein
MAKSLYSEAAASRNIVCDLSVASSVPRASHNGSLLPADAPCVPGGMSDVAYSNLCPSVVVALLAAAGTADVVPLSDLVSAIPNHPAPLAAVMALVDRNLLGMDIGSAFDAGIGVWRLSPLP